MKDQAEALRELVKENNKVKKNTLFSVINTGSSDDNKVSIELARSIGKYYKDILILDLSNQSKKQSGFSNKHFKMLTMKDIKDLLVEKNNVMISNFINSYDVVIINYRYSNYNNLVKILNYSGETLLVIDGSEEGILEGYGLIKSLKEEKDYKYFNIVISNVDSIEQGKKIFNSLKETTNSFLNIDLNNTGYISKKNRLIIEDVDVFIMEK